jgi:hypothetical protein
VSTKRAGRISKPPPSASRPPLRRLLSTAYHTTPNRFGALLVPTGSWRPKISLAFSSLQVPLFGHVRFCMAQDQLNDLLIRPELIQIRRNATPEPMLAIPFHPDFSYERMDRRPPRPGNRRRLWTGHDCGQTPSSSAKRPSGGSSLRFGRPIGAHCAWRDIDIQLHRQLRCHARLSPSRILFCHLHDEFADVLRKSWPTSLRLPFFHLQNNLKPLGCQPIMVSGLTITKASFQLQS